MSDLDRLLALSPAALADEVARRFLPSIKLRVPLADVLGYARDWTREYGWRLVAAQMYDLYALKGDGRGMLTVRLE